MAAIHQGDTVVLKSAPNGQEFPVIRVRGGIATLLDYKDRESNHPIDSLLLRLNRGLYRLETRMEFERTGVRPVPAKDAR